MDGLPFPPGRAPRALLSNYQLFKTSDIEEARQWGARVFCENSLQRNGRSARIDARMYYRRLRNLGLGRLSYGGDITIAPGTFESFYLVQMPLCGREEVRVGDEEVRSTAGVASIINAMRPAVVHHWSDTEKLTLRIERSALEHHCEQHLGHALRAPLSFRAALPLDTADGRRWMSLMHWLFDNLSNEDDELPPLFAAQAEQMVIATLLGAQPHNYSAELAGEEPSIAPAFVKRIEEYIDEHADEPISIVDLAAHAGVSSRSIYAGFRRFRNTSPMSYLKEVRLQRVHAELRQAPPGSTTVTAAAYRWGFGHLGHFTTDYKRRFGESPSETLAR